MADEGNGGETPGKSVKLEDTWTTGDPERDWKYFEGRADRTDAAIRMNLGLLLGTNAILLIALAIFMGVEWGNYPLLPTFILTTLPWLGFVVSICFHWSQYHHVLYRRELEMEWKSLYPNQHPTPFGLGARFQGSPGFVPEVLLVFASGLVWFLLLTGALCSMLLSDRTLRNDDMQTMAAVTVSSCCSESLFSELPLSGTTSTIAKQSRINILPKTKQFDCRVMQTRIWLTALGAKEKQNTDVATGLTSYREK